MNLLHLTEVITLNDFYLTLQDVFKNANFFIKVIENKLEQINFNLFTFNRLPTNQITIRPSSWSSMNNVRRSFLQDHELHLNFFNFSLLLFLTRDLD